MARRPTFARVTIYDTQIAKQFAPGFSAYRFGQKISGEISRMAKRTAPRGNFPRSGQKILANSHNFYSLGGRRANESRWVISNTARHAEWVHNGTQGPITPKTRAYMTFRAGGKRGGGFVRAKSVRGQRANPWLQRAASIVNARYQARGPSVG